MLEAIEEIHKVGYIHRDVKPSNFRMKGDKVYLTDFGTITEFIRNGVILPWK